MGKRLLKFMGETVSGVVWKVSKDRSLILESICTMSVLRSVTHGMHGQAKNVNLLLKPSGSDAVLSK